MPFSEPMPKASPTNRVEGRRCGSDELSATAARGAQAGARVFMSVAANNLKDIRLPQWVVSRSRPSSHV